MANMENERRDAMPKVRADASREQQQSRQPLQQPHQPEVPDTRNGKPGFNQEQRQKIASSREIVVKAFTVILALGCLVGSLFFLRPSVSQVENRNLTPFPAFTIETFINGQFFSDLSLWYADTFPFREQLVALDHGLKSFYGISPKEGMVGGNVKSDEIPAEGSGAAQAHEVVEPPTERVMAEDIQNKIMNSLYVKDGASYSIYYFSQEGVQNYAAAINECAKKLEGKATVYSVLAPNNSGVMLTEQEQLDLGGSDQKQAIRYFNSLYDDKVVGVQVIDKMREHNNEYLYFYSDHHWTQLGAYYAYLCYCEAAGIQPVALEGKQKYTFEPFYGTTYNQLSNSGLTLKSDSVDAYVPNGTNKLEYKPEDSDDWKEGEVVRDVTGWNDSSYYGTFIAGDQPLEKIENPAITDGSSVLVVKDSYGNAFVPLLVDNYQYVYVIDFRYYDGSIPKFVEENGIKNVIFLNNMSIAGTVSVSEKLMSMMQ